MPNRNWLKNIYIYDYNEYDYSFKDKIGILNCAKKIRI